MSAMRMVATALALMVVAVFRLGSVSGQGADGGAPTVVAVPVYYYYLPAPPKAGAAAGTSQAGYLMGGAEPSIIIFLPQPALAPGQGTSSGAINGRVGSFSTPRFHKSPFFGALGSALVIDTRALLNQRWAQGMGRPGQMLLARPFVVTRSWTTRDFFRDSSFHGSTFGGSMLGLGGFRASSSL